MVSLGVPQNYSFDVNFSTGFSEGGEMLAKWVGVIKISSRSVPLMLIHRLASSFAG